MTRFGILGTTALSLSLIVAAPALAQQQHSDGRAGAKVGGSGGVRTGGNFSGRVGGAPQANFSGARANVVTNGNAQFAQRGTAQFAQPQPGGGGALRGDRTAFRGGRDRGFARDAGIAAGVAVGAGVAYGAYGYDPYYYGDSYAYDSGAYYDPGYTVAYDQPAVVGVEGPVGIDPSYCALRFRSYDPASGTYLGFDGLRHPCP